MLYLVIAALVVVALVVATPLLRRPNRLDEVDRFHVARSLTTSWSSGQPAPEQRATASGEQPDES
ncbi:MAG: hypothetical protein ACXVFV_07845 [Mycobacteriales bacterium]